MKKLISIIITALLLFSSTAFSVSADELPFKDVKANAWYYQYVKTAYEEGLMQGKSSSIFEPKSQMTRAELVTVLYRLSGDTVDTSDSLTFTDTKADAWYADSIVWAINTELTTGYPDNTFRPNAPVKRDELAVFIGRFMASKNLPLPNRPLIESFTDSKLIPDWAGEQVDSLRIAGVFVGDENGCFNPSSTATRAEISKIAGMIRSFIYKNARFESFVMEEDFLYCDDGPEVPILFRIYLPENYNENEEYPLLVYLHGNGKQGKNNWLQLDAVAKCFTNPYSPAFDSIVVAPQCPNRKWWTGEQIDKIAALIDYVNERYSTDMSRQYVMGHSMGGNGTWELMSRYPGKVSAAVPVAGVGLTYATDGDGKEIIMGMTEDMLVTPICIVYDNDDIYSDGDYNRRVYNTLLENGAKYVTYRETSGVGHLICDSFINSEDISILDWLYAQERDVG